MKKLLVLIIFLLIGFLLVSGFWGNNLLPVSSDQTEKTFLITKGEALSSIIQRLKENNLIRSELAFSLYLKKEGLDQKIQPGTFKISPSLSSEEIAKILISNPEEVWVTLIEGWRVEEVAEELNLKLGVDKERFLDEAIEGYMFPDTYLFPRDYTESQIAKILQNTFNQKYTEDLKNKIKAQGLTETEGVILASIVEREGRSDKVRVEVASILLKRFKIDMGLNADATLQYILGYQEDEKSWWKRHLTNEDKKIDSPYNTYLYRGLPPAPIANPSLSSLQAVAEADPSTPYLYYYHDSKGNSHYGRDLDEHNENVANNP